MIWNPCAAPTGAWEELDPYVNAHVSGTACPSRAFFGPELTLGAELNAHLGETAYLMKFAIGQTWLAPPACTSSGAVCADAPGCTPCYQDCGDSCNLSPATSWDPDCEDIYGDMLAELDLAVADLAPLEELDVQGVFWAQGSWDARSSCEASAYEVNLRALIDRLRADLQSRGLTSQLEVPFVISQVPDYLVAPLAPSQTPYYPEVDTVRTAERIVACDSSTVGIFDPSEMPHYNGTQAPCDPVQSDFVHFNAVGQKGHGRGLFRAWLDLNCPALVPDESHFVLSAGGSSQELHFAEPGFAGASYVLASSTSGAGPSQHGAVSVPLTPDAYFFASTPPFAMPPPVPLVTGTLDAAGEASLTFSYPTAPAYQGLRFNHSLLILTGVSLNSLIYASNSVGLTVLP